MSNVALAAAARSSSAVFAPPVNTTEKASATSWIAVLASMIGAFMAILNIQITNASLLDIEGGIRQLPVERTAPQAVGDRLRG